MRGPGLKPVLFAFVAAALWGLWWIPIRFLEARGLDGALGGVALNLGAFLAGVVWMALRREPPRLTSRGLAGAALIGVAVSSFSAALAMGEVVRVVLLFYVAPAWSKLIEWAFLGVAWRWTSTLAVAAALGGAVLVTGGGAGLAGGIGTADMVAVSAGVAWAAGAALVFTSVGGSAAALTVATALSATLAGLLFAVLAGVVLPGAELAPAVLTGMAGGAVYVLPIMALTLWSARKLSPATLTFLLTAEILTGVFSGVLLLDEPFGPVRAAGAALIVLGAVSEVLPVLRRPGPGVAS